MAGFFGLFNYSKEGPGVSKEEPQKHRFFLFFDLYFRKFWKLITLNLLFVVSCIPIVTIGAASAGFTLVLRNFVQEKPVFLLSDYLDAIKKNWKMSSGVFFLNLLVAFIIFSSYSFYTDPNFIVNPWIRTICTSIMFIVSMIFVFMQYYMYFMIVTFHLTFKQLLKNAFIFAFLGLGRNILISLCILIFGVAIFVLGLISPLAIILYLTIFFSTTGFIINFMAYPLVKKYMIDPALAEQKAEEEPTEKDQIFNDITNKKK